MPAMGAKPLHIKLREKRNRPPEGEPWVWMTRSLLESDAWRTAPPTTRRFVEFLMVEHSNHGGCENGKLIATFEQLEKWGIRRKSIPKAQRDAIRRGLVYRTEKGCRSAGRGRRPHRFGLSWYAGYDGSAPPNRWKAYRASPPLPRGRPFPRKAQPPTTTQDIYSSSKTAPGANGANPWPLANKVAKAPLDKVAKAPLGEHEYQEPEYTPMDIARRRKRLRSLSDRLERCRPLRPVF
jgi:hypothetical protein